MKRLIHIIVLVFLSVSVWADEVSFRASAPSTVEAGGKFRVQFTVNTQNVSGFSAPDFKGFEVIYGPATSSQSSFLMINGSPRKAAVSSTPMCFLPRLLAHTPSAVPVCM